MKNKKENLILNFLSDDEFSIRDNVFTVNELRHNYLEVNLSHKQMCEKYGISAKTMTSLLTHYHIQKTKELIAEIRKKTCLEKYGVESISQSEKIKSKVKKTCLERYGVTNPQQSLLIQEKTKQTNLKKYGGIAPACNSKVRAKMEQTNLERYGVKNCSQNVDIREKVKQTNLEKFGVECNLSLKEVQEKIKQTNCKKYSTPYFVQKDIKNFEIWNNAEKMRDYLLSLPKKPTIYDLCLFFNVYTKGNNNLADKLREYGLQNLVTWKPARSHYEDEIIDWLKQEWPQIQIEINNRQVLSSKKEIDIYLPEYKIGIEFNGNYWHSDLIPTYQDHNGRSVVHQKKSLEAEKQGIFLFHVFEYEWNNEISQKNIKNRLRTLLKNNKKDIYARNCEIKSISKEEKKNFLNQNHIQGNDHSNYYIGLYYDDRLVSCMTFTKSKYNKYNYELSRFCSLHETNVIGGASRLFKYFINNVLKTGETVVSYNDITKTKGDIYRILGFENTSINSPNYIWMNFTTGDIRSRYQEQAAGEVERMHSQGYHRICDCGTKTWVYIKK